MHASLVCCCFFFSVLLIVHEAQPTSGHRIIQEIAALIEGQQLRQLGAGVPEVCTDFLCIFGEGVHIAPEMLTTSGLHTFVHPEQAKNVIRILPGGKIHPLAAGDEPFQSGPDLSAAWRAFSERPGDNAYTVVEAQGRVGLEFCKTLAKYPNVSLPEQISLLLRPENLQEAASFGRRNFQALNELGYRTLWQEQVHDFHSVLLVRAYNRPEKPLLVAWDGKDLDWTDPWWGRPGIPFDRDLCLASGLFRSSLNCEFKLWYNSPETQRDLRLADVVLTWPGYSLNRLKSLRSYDLPSSTLIYMSVGEALASVASPLFPSAQANGVVVFQEQRWREIAAAGGDNQVVLYGLVPHRNQQDYLWAWESEPFTDLLLRGHMPVVPGYAERKTGPVLSFISSRSVTSRDQLYEKLAQAGFQIDCYGAVGQKNPDPEVISACGRTRNKAQKSCVQQHYRFCLTIENTDSPGYHTEKLFDALSDGCIPVYFGHEDVDDFIPPNSIVKIKRFENNLQDLWRLLQKIDEDPELWQSYQQWRDSNTAWFNPAPLIPSLLPCLICDHALGRKQFPTK